MKIRPQTLRFLVAAIVAACAGLIGLQIVLLMNTADLKRSTFRQNVLAALGAAARAIEDREIIDRVFFVQRAPGVARSGNVAFNGAARDSLMTISVLSTGRGTVRTWFQKGTLVTSADRPQRVTVEALDAFGRLDTTLLGPRRIEGEHVVTLPSGRLSGGPILIRVRTDDGVSTLKIDASGKASGYTTIVDDSDERERMVRKVVESMARTGPRLTAGTLRAAELDSLVGTALRTRAIDIPYSTAMFMGDSCVLGAGRGARAGDGNATYSLPVTVGGPFGSPETISVHFPSQTTYILGEMGPEIALSVLLLVIVVWIFVSTVRTIVRQQEFGSRLTGFINNMTHEFKTPIATIALASEALDRSDVRRSARRLGSYNGIIRDENQRMARQVERILHMASLEEGEVEIHRESVAMNGVVGRAADHARLQASHRGGTLSAAFNASNDVVAGDRVHLENVVHNLLDNALKYSPSAPAIEVETRTQDGRFVVTVRDRGHGIPADQIERVFEKYYRIPTGDLHEVKGFGLGLSYVRLVVGMHGGTVVLRSREGKGTEAEIALPLERGTQ